MSLMENWIQSYGTNINAVFAQNDEMGMGALLAELRELQLQDELKTAKIETGDVVQQLAQPEDFILVPSPAARITVRVMRV